jgi:hypothetical protein
VTSDERGQGGQKKGNEKEGERGHVQLVEGVGDLKDQDVREAVVLGVSSVGHAERQSRC